MAIGLRGVGAAKEPTSKSVAAGLTPRYMAKWPTGSSGFVVEGE